MRNWTSSSAVYAAARASAARSSRPRGPDAGRVGSCRSDARRPARQGPPAAPAGGHAVRRGEREREQERDRGACEQCRLTQPCGVRRAPPSLGRQLDPAERRDRNRDRHVDEKDPRPAPASTSCPPSSGPLSAPSGASVETTPSARPLAPGVTASTARTGASASRSAAMAPCPIRAPMSRSMRGASPGEAARQREPGTSDAKRASATHDVDPAPAQKRQRDERHDVRQHDPLRRRRRRAEVVLDARQRDQHDRRVELRHEDDEPGGGDERPAVRGVGRGGAHD